MYRLFLKRFFDIMLSFIALAVLSPVFIILILVGAVAMRGNPFFTQLRPGKKEKIFRLIKFRTMTNKKDSDGNLLSDDARLTKYGRLLRKTSLDELPEIINIFIGKMSIVGPRPLLPEYLPYYKEEERRRHSVRPGLTGLAQVSGRNLLSWEERFALDVQYVDKTTFALDVKILWRTVINVIKQKDIAVGSQHVLQRLDVERQEMVSDAKIADGERSVSV